MTIDFDGISIRVARVPLGAENYGGLTAKTGHLLYGVGGAFYYGRQGDRTTSSANLRVEGSQRNNARRKTFAATHCLTTARRSWSHRARPTISTMQPRSAKERVRQSRPLVCMSIECRLKSGTRSSMKFGDVIATGSTCRTCTVTTGSHCANSTSRC